ncbi:MAG TPA: RDD family protein [Chloroflexota bacterium]|nr:RDD family protein [Chloroflexota bacterium]
MAGMYDPGLLSYPSFWRRLIAGIADAVILGILALVMGQALAIFAIHPALGLGTRDADVIGLVVNFTVVAALIMSWLYYTLFESSAKQATPGKIILGLVVTDLNGRRLSLGRANARFWTRALSVLTLMIGFLLAAFTRRRQTLHDIVSGCLVMRSIY